MMSATRRLATAVVAVTIAGAAMGSFGAKVVIECLRLYRFRR